jgi:hypothetical protein
MREHYGDRHGNYRFGRNGLARHSILSITRGMKMGVTGDLWQSFCGMLASSSTCKEPDPFARRKKAKPSDSWADEKENYSLRGAIG